MSRPKFRRGLQVEPPVVLGGHQLTVTASELNELHGQGLQAADVAKVVGLTGTAAELNRVDDTLYGTAGNSLVRVAKAQYDFEVLGGEQSTISLGVALPDNAIVLDGIVEVVTVADSDGAATVAVQIEGADDLIAATAFDGAPWSTTGLKAIIPDGTAAKALKLTAARNISVVIGTADLKAGKFNVWLRWLQGD